MSNPVSAWRIEQAMSIANAVKTRLLADDPDLAMDETALRDTLDGETDAYDIVRRLIRFSIEAKAMATAANSRVDDLIARRNRYNQRAETARGAAFGMLDALGEVKLTDPEFTASISKGRPGVLITDETALPDDVMQVTRAPDRAAIKAALMNGTQIPGAELSNSAPTLTVRTK